METEGLLAERTAFMGENAIREILKVVSKEGMISLAGGIPAPESFPLEIVKELSVRVLEKYGSDALQYGLTEGFVPLREALCDYVKPRGISASANDIIVTSGSQGALDSISKILISEGDKIAVESPTYLGAISAFNPYRPEYVTIETDSGGVIPESLEEVLSSNRIKFIYLVPTFQNPTGRTIGTERRKKIADIIVKYNALLLEDDPYSALRYEGDDIPAFKSMIPENTVYIGTLSKVLSPGLRVGFVIAPSLIKNWSVIAKQGIDLHTGSFSQAIGFEYLKGGYFEKHLPKICEIYRPKKNAMLSALEKYFPDSYKWSRPEGGMFVWVEGPSESDTLELYKRAIDNNVAFVPGKYFFTGDTGKNAMRLNFTMGTEEKIDQALERLSKLL